MWAKYFLSGFVVKLIAGFDDTMTRIPIVANMTRTKTGRISFAFGIFLAITLAIIVSFLFGSLIKAIPYSNYISAGLIFLLAIVIYFEVFTRKGKKVLKKEVVVIKKISNKKILKLIAIGFVTGLATIIDDTIAYAGLFLNTLSNSGIVIFGILVGTMLQLIVIVYFSEKFSKIKYKKEITVIGLLILGFLIMFNFL